MGNVNDQELGCAFTTPEYSFEFLRKWGTKGTGDGQFELPRGLAIDGDGNVYVADPADNRIQVFKRVLPSG